MVFKSVTDERLVPTIYDGYTHPDYKKHIAIYINNKST